MRTKGTRVLWSASAAVKAFPDVVAAAPSARPPSSVAANGQSRVARYFDNAHARTHDGHDRDNELIHQVYQSEYRGPRGE